MITSQKIVSYYDLYKSMEVTFTKEIIHVIGMITQQVYLKCSGDSFPCVIYTTSFEGAKIVANTKSGLVNKLQQANQAANLRFCFTSQESATPVTFFVPVRSTGYSPYGSSPDMAIFTLQFTQRPPDDLIEVMGRLLDANRNSVKRKDEQITLTPETQRRLKVLPKESAAFIQGVPRRCIVRDLSFGAAKLIIMGVAKFLVDKESALRIEFDDPRESFLIRGKFANAELVEGRKELVALDLIYTEAQIPMGYKIRINDYLGQIWAGSESRAFAPGVAPSPRAVKPPSQAFPAAETPEATLEPVDEAPAPASVTPVAEETPPTAEPTEAEK
ncbi:cyclic di-GMP binding protein [Spirochaetia bacterium]|nr:cyclic di-GMP binding protein [Spirochaetia bacterium]